MDRDRGQLDREEKKIEMEIKKAAKAGNKAACTVLAKQIVQIRKQKQRTLVASSQVGGVYFGPGEDELLAHFRVCRMRVLCLLIF
jgi:hypothetical protein